MSLRKWYDSLSTQCGCSTFYCTTCGCIAGVVAKSGLNYQSTFDELLNLSKLELHPADFQCFAGRSFPKDSECSGYVSCLRFLIDRLENDDADNLVTKWVLQAADSEDYIVDGVGYYLIPNFAKSKWLPILLGRANNRSIAETIRLKYQ